MYWSSNLIGSFLSRPERSLTSYSFLLSTSASHNPDFTEVMDHKDESLEASTIPILKESHSDSPIKISSDASPNNTIIEHDESFDTDDFGELLGKTKLEENGERAPSTEVEKKDSEAPGNSNKTNEVDNGELLEDLSFGSSIVEIVIGTESNEKHWIKPAAQTEEKKVVKQGYETEGEEEDDVAASIHVAQKEQVSTQSSAIDSAGQKKAVLGHGRNRSVGEKIRLGDIPKLNPTAATFQLRVASPSSVETLTDVKETSTLHSEMKPLLGSDKASNESKSIAVSNDDELKAQVPEELKKDSLPDKPTRDSFASRSSAFEKFLNIVDEGKDEHGTLTKPAREALNELGYKPIPSLHGPNSLPYARCPSSVISILLFEFRLMTFVFQWN